MADVQIIQTKGGQVRIEGLRQAMRALQKAGADSQEMSGLMHEIGMIPARAAQPPRRSGALASTIRAGRGKTKAVVRAGFASVPYAGVQHYGWPARNITPKPFFTDALQKTRPQIFAALEKGIDQIIKTNGLK